MPVAQGRRGDNTPFRRGVLFTTSKRIALAIGSYKAGTCTCAADVNIKTETGPRFE